MKTLKRSWWLAAPAVAIAASAVTAAVASAGTDATANTSSSTGGGLGQTSGLLPRDHLTLENAIQVDLSHETVRLPIYKGIPYKGTPKQETVWYPLMDAPHARLAHDLGGNYAPPLAHPPPNSP